MKILPWLLVVVALAGVGFLYSANKKRSAEVTRLEAETEQFRAAAEEAKKEHAQAEESEIVRLRKENEDLLRLRNEVRKLRDDKQQLSKQVQLAENQAQNAQAQAQSAQAQAQAARAAQAAQPPPDAATAAQLAAQQTAQRPPTPEQERTAACVNNLRQIDGAKQQWALERQKPVGTFPNNSDLSPYLKNNVVPACPGGGVYTLNPIGAPPTCTLPGHVIPR